MFDHNIIKVSHGQTIRNKSGELTGIPNGSPLTIHTLKEMLDYQATLKDGDKKEFGGIYPFEDTIKREKASCDLTYKSGHVMFFDIDELPDEYSKKKVFDSFDDIIQYMPNLYAMCFSSSGNVHAFVFVQERYNYEEYYLVEAALLCKLCRTIEVVTGIELYPGSTRNVDKVAIAEAYGKSYDELPHNLDMHNANMFQQIYLAASPWPEKGYQLNEMCSPVVLTEDVMKSLFEYYHYVSLIKQCDEYYHPKNDDGIDKKVKSTGYSVKSGIPGKIIVEDEIDHDARWQMRNMLAYSLGYERGDKVFMQVLEAYDDMRKRKGMERKRNVKTMFDLADGGKKSLRKNKDGKIYCSYTTREIMKRLGFEFDVSTSEDPFVKSISSTASIDVLGMEDYLLSRIDYIKSEIDKHQVNLVKAPTGTGKTELFKELSHHMKIAICTPFVSMGGIYGKKQDGSPVSPVDNVLRSRSIDDSVEQWIEEGGSLVGVWDQIVGVFQRLIDGGYTLVVDESHTLCPGTSYRGRAIRFGILLDKYISMGGKVVFVTATPTLEEMEFPNVKINRIEFDKVCRSRKIDVYYNILNKKTVKKDEEKKGEDEKEPSYELHRGTAEWRMLGDVMKNYYRQAFDYVLVVSDLYNTILCEKLRAKGINVHQLNNSNPEPSVVADMKKVNDECRLEKGVYVGTCYIENGFNINNDKGSALVIMDVRKDKFSYAKILQTIGRFRKLKNVYAKVYIEGVEGEREDGVVVKVTEKQKLTPYEKQLKSESITNSGLEIGFDEDMLITDYILEDGEEQKVAVRYKIDGYEFSRKAFEEYIRLKYEKEHGNAEQLKRDLEVNGMEVELFDMLNEDVNNIMCKTIRKEKKEMEKKAWEMLMGREEYDDDYMVLRYPRELNVLYKRLCGLYGKDIIVSFADKLLEATPENNRSTILQTLEDNLPWLYHDDEWCEGQRLKAKGIMKRLEEVAKEASEKGVRYDVSIICKEIKSSIDKKVKWRKKYGMIQNVDEDVPRIEAIMDNDIVLALKVRSDAHKGEHKKHKRKLLKVVEDGFIGTTEEVMEHIGKNRDTVTRWKKEGKVEEV